MKTVFNHIFFLLLVAILLVACNQKPKYSNANKYAGLQDSIQTWIVNAELIGAEILIVENEELVIHEAYGWSDLESGDKLKKGSIWTVMSMTKPFTATAILMLIEDGVIKLDDLITDFFKNYNGDKRITIRHLLAQSSGDNGNYGNGGHNVLNFNSLDEWIEDWANQQSEGKFGEFAYSNFNYGALAYIVEQVSKMSVEAFIQERIIKPMNLKNTHVRFVPDSSWAGLVSSRFQWNEPTNSYEKSWSNDEPQSWKFFTGALGLWMSAEDYATFMQMWMNEGQINGVQFLEKSTVEEGLKIESNAYGEKLFGHGYGWFIDEEPLIFRYGGSAGGVGIGYPEKETIVIYLTHCSGGNHKNKFQDELDRIWFSNDN